MLDPKSTLYENISQTKLARVKAVFASPRGQGLKITLSSCTKVTSEIISAVPHLGRYVRISSQFEVKCIDKPVSSAYLDGLRWTGTLRFLSETGVFSKA